ncbi:hypothetical protein QBC42DRAFT_349661 [Cladorrhinum samala]|uniref:Uncharacterized protein n=1 Tax=Cladorrhinum samala TaxID=585594 RepID=A0AAV9HCL7_9PEZI|nr:hypothetical protein QBC42DRAFT_349661 [Cladorrhinum samala]
MFDHKASLLVAGLQLLGLCSGKQLEFFKSGLSPARNLDRRQTAPPGYHPEFGACGSGTSCEDACGANWLSCTASTDLSLFCYNNADFGQTCCENGSGRACDRGYYCAWQTFGGRVWCCEDGQSLEECGVPSGGVTTRSSTSTASRTSTSSTATGSSSSGTNTDTATTSGGGGGGGGGSGSGSSTPTDCGSQATVTSWATTTLFATVEVTVGGCSSDSTFAPSSHSLTNTGSITATITLPPISSTTSRPITNTTTTRTIVTAGAGGVRLNAVALGLAVLPLLW